MKKIILLLLLILMGCANRYPNKDEIKSYSSEELLDLFEGVSVDEIRDLWGEPDGGCSGLYCDFFYYDKDQLAVIYYDWNGKVYEIRK